MRSLHLAILSAAFSVLAFGAHAESENSRTTEMPFAECLSIIAEISDEVGEDPVRLVNTGDLQSVRINAEDGFVTVSCSRADNMMTLSKSAVPAAAGQVAAR